MRMARTPTSTTIVEILMTTQTKRALSLTLLAQRGIARGSYAPLLFRLLWKFGVDIPPPHFIGFAKLAVIWGAWFALAWGAFMWFAVWSRQGTLPPQAAAIAIGAGAFFGLCLSAIYARDRKKHALPRWESIG